MGAITEAQDLFLKMIGHGQRNALDGPAIEAALRANMDLWRSVVLTREASVVENNRLGGAVDLIVLRDLPNDFVNLDTLFVLAEPGRQSELEALAKQWDADEVGWVGQDEAFRAMGDSAVVNKAYADDKERVVLRVWWD